jgi:hypothetical protein
MVFITGLPEDVGCHIVSFLGVPTLVQKKVICRSWRALFTDTIERKAPVPKAFESGDQLRMAVKRYARYDPKDAEDFATTCGWPIARWDVSNVEVLNHVFGDHLSNFNESIGSWDVSNATSMISMFEFVLGHLERHMDDRNV